MYDYPPSVTLFVYGDGRLATQAYQITGQGTDNDPEDPYLMMNRNFAATCTARADVAEITSVIQLMIEKHFFDLPELSFSYQTAAYVKPNLELHSIVVDDGQRRAGRTFGTGTFNNQPENIPPDFAAIEAALGKLRDAHIHGPCRFAPGIKF